jgi:predicted small lipoprotein YifL
MRIFLALALALAATGCGQTGALFLPDDAVETPVEIRGPGEASTPAEPEIKEEKEEEKAAPPPGR